MINPIEIIVTVFYVILIILIAFILRSILTNSLTKKYFFPALYLKIVGAVFVGLIYYFYYKGGDTITYYDHGAEHIFKAFLDSPSTAFSIIFGDNVRTAENIEYTANIWVYRDSASFTVVRFAGLLNLFAFNTYGGTACLFAFLSFLCIWKSYSVLQKRYPHLHKELAIAFFFIPSVFFWGSGILKDTITFAFLNLLIASTLEVFFHKRKIFLNILFIIISAYLIKSIKIYILLAIIPALGFIFLFGPISKIKNKLVRISIKPLILTVAIFLSIIGIKFIGESSQRYKLDELSNTAESTARWIHYVSVSQGGAAYSFGDYDFSTFGVIKKTIPAIWVTLFRPHPWEVKNPVMLLSALEALFFLYLLFTLFKNTSFKKIRTILKNDLIISFCLIFSLIFSWAVGLTTYNFGSLVRYKIPMIPFFVFGIYLIRYYTNKDKNIS